MVTLVNVTVSSIRELLGIDIKVFSHTHTKPCEVREALIVGITSSYTRVSSLLIVHLNDTAFYLLIIHRKTWKNVKRMH